MIALVLSLVLAATATVDTTVRVPGTSLRFGTESARFGAVQGFAPATTEVQPGRVAREGSQRFFGIASQATLQFESRRLVEANFVIEQASPHQIAYVEDDLARRGFTRRCVIREAERSVCDWTGSAVLRIEVTGTNLTASIKPARPILAWSTTESDSLTPAASLRRVDSVPVHPDTLRLATEPQGNLQPRIVSAPGRPAVPPSAVVAGVQGVVFVLALVDTTGRVRETVIGEGISELNEAALLVAKTYRFEPMIVDDRKVRYWVELPIRFTLH